MRPTGDSESSLRFRLGIGFGLILLFMIALTVTGICWMTALGRDADRLVKDFRHKQNLAFIMKDALRERAILMHTIALLKDPFDQDELYQRFSAFGNRYATARNEISTLTMRPEGKAILARMNELTVRTQPMVIEALDNAMRGRNDLALAQIKDKVTPAQNAIAGEINKLTEFQEQQTDRAFEEILASSNLARWLMFVLGGITAALSVLVAVVVIRQVINQARSLKHQALYDGLTALPNRVLFADRLNQSVLVSSREKQSFSVISMDLDRFKEINDTLGHQAGDAVLQHLATRIGGVLRHSDTMARMGGDEFTFLLPTASNAAGAIEVAKKIIHTLVTPLQIGERKVDANVSLGIAMYPDHGADADTLMRNSDAAMYAAKRAQAGYRVFSAEMDQGSDQRLMLLADLRRAVAGEELVLFYQPKVDLTSNRIDGVEALVRWQHPTHGLLTPDKFISLAEQTGLIKPLTERVLTLALQQCARWRQSGLTLTMAVNVSTINIQDSEFPARVAELIQAAGVPASSLELEITETAVMLDPARAIDCITRLNALGLLIAIDDFGTGYSSMSYLKKLMIAKIKIDRSFVKDMTTHHHDGVIVRSTIELGHNLGLTVVAEGVENQASWDELKTLGCDAAQGYFFSRPVSADQFVEWLQNSEWGKRCVSSGSG